MRGKIAAVVAIGLALAAGPAKAQQSDLIPRQELRERMRRLHDELHDGFSSRAFGSRMRAEALATARAQRESARAFARMNRDFARSRAQMRIPRMPVMRARVHRRYRDI